MSAIITNNFKIQNAINFTSVANDSNYYITIGKIDEWQDKSLKPTNTLATYRSLWNNMIGGKAISKDRVSLVIPRINWTQNVLYSMYDDATVYLDRKYSRCLEIKETEAKYQLKENNSKKGEGHDEEI